MSNPPIRVVIVDDHPVVRAGLAAMLSAAKGFEVIAEAADGESALAVVREHEPDVVLMDVRMPKLDGVEATARVRKACSKTAVLVMSAFDNEHDVVRALAAGAVGYVLKDAAREELLEAVRTVARGGSALSPTAASRLVGRMHGRAESVQDALTARELDVLRLVASGANNREIGKKLRVSEATIKTHLLHVFPKLGVKDRTAAVTEALTRGILKLDE
jgi:DNA-binding NarL/FixJ family response regulator